MKRRLFIQKISALSLKNMFLVSAVSTLKNDAMAGKIISTKQHQSEGELLYNGIQLPKIWPPVHFNPQSSEPMPVPYLDKRPEVIPIDIGRQLFVDDFLIETTNLRRKYHSPQKFQGNPVFKPLTAAETGGTDGKKTVVYSGHGGIFFDQDESIFKMFYRAGWLGALAMATSKNMINWRRPELGLAGGNVLLPKGPAYTGEDLLTAGSDNSVWLDMNAMDPKERIKYLTCWMHVPENQRPSHTTHTMHVSDGKTWSKGRPTGKVGDYCSFFYNPFRKVWVSSIRISDGPRGRCRYYSENPKFLDGADWSKAVYWTNTDRLDQPEPIGGYPAAGEIPQLYSLNAVAYESIMIGMHHILRGPKNSICDEGKFPKLIDLEVGFSRDGFHWHRPNREAFIPAERREGAWDRAYVHSITGVFVVLRDKLIFPFTAFSGIAADGSRGSYTGGSIGMASLRRDGFASMEADSVAGTLTTRPVIFSGKHLFINASVEGYLRAEVRDLDQKPVLPFSLANSIPFTGDQTIEQMQWKGGDDLSLLSGKPVRLHFELSNGSFFAFWISKDGTGRSDGYVAAGGPGYDSTIDTKGKLVMLNK